MLAETGLLALGFLTLMVVGIEIMFTYATQGFAYGFSSNRPAVDVSPFAQRMKRVLQNQVECAAYAVPILAAVALVGLNDTAVQTAVAVCVVGRLAYVVFYYTGLPFARVPFFLAANLALLFLSYRVVLHAFN